MILAPYQRPTPSHTTHPPPFFFCPLHFSRILVLLSSFSDPLSSDLISSYLILSHLISSHLISSYLIILPVLVFLLPSFFASKLFLYVRALRSVLTIQTSPAPGSPMELTNGDTVPTVMVTCLDAWGNRTAPHQVRSSSSIDVCSSLLV
jgi:hypothetical protein